MANPRKSTRKRIVQAALELFAIQGVTETTTRQIAERADVNEVTLFRNFGSKHGLLLAVIREAEALTQLGDVLGQKADQMTGFDTALRAYAEGYLEALDRIREFVRSLVGEAGQYPPENRQAIADGLNQVHRFTEQYLATVMAREAVPKALPVSTLASMLNALLLGYALIDLTTEFHDLWQSRDAFINDVVGLLQSGLTQPEEEGLLAEPTLPTQPEAVMDLPGPLVRTILQTARKASLQDYAIAYVLFGAGLSPRELISLKRIHSIADSQQHLLQIPDSPRQVPLNQWIMGYRYGSYTKNPLTQWLKSRKDSEAALFLNEAGQPLTEVELRLRWQELTAPILTPIGQPPEISQAQQTWCVEMLMRGMDPQGLCFLTGWNREQLEPYVQRAQARTALEQALRLDQKSGKGGEGGE